MCNREMPGFIHGIQVISSQAVILIKTVVLTVWKIKGLDAMSRIACSVQDFNDELKTDENINEKKLHYFLRWI